MCLLLKSSVLLVLNIISMMALESSALSALFVETLLGQGKGPKIQKVFKESKKWVKNVMFLVCMSSLSTTSNMDRQLLRQKSRQKFSVIKTKKLVFPEK